MPDLADLKRRVEEASGPDRELDCLIEATIVHKAALVKSDAWSPPRMFANPNPEIDWVGYDLLNTAGRYTASLDATVALIERVLPEAGWHVGKNVWHGYWNAQILMRSAESELSISSSTLSATGSAALALLSALLAAMGETK